MFIGEYLFGMGMLDTFNQPGTFLCSFSFAGCHDSMNAGGKFFSSLVYTFAFHRNRLKTVFSNYYRLLIQGIQKTPPDTEEADRYIKDYTENPTIRNLAGWLMARFYYTDSASYVKRLSIIRSKSDLLSIHLHEITGAAVTLSDPYTGKPYVLKKNGDTLSSPGKDGVFDTDDDVILGMKKENKK
jgi:hypothetical protein